MQGTQVVDNNTYNLVTAFAKSLEALEVYAKYAKDGHQELWGKLSQQTREQAQMLQQELMKTMGQSSQNQPAQPQMGAELPDDEIFAKANQALNGDITTPRLDNTPGNGADENMDNRFNEAKPR